MSDELLQYYNRELAYLRRQGAEFAQAYPKVAGRLRISEESVEDPHVSRLLEGVAFMTAQIRQRLDGHFPELTDILMGTLYPDYQAPIPSMTVLQLEPSASQTHSARLKDNQGFDTSVERMPNCEFHASGEHHLAPISVTGARFENSPFDAPRPPGAEAAQSVIRIRLEGAISLQEMDVPNLRFYLHGQTHHSHELYDLILRTGLGFAVVPVDDRDQLRFFPADQIQPVGFDSAEALVPYGQRSFDGFRLLVEHFLFPEKFLFAQLNGLEGQWPDTSQVDLYIYLGESSAEQEKSFIADHMRLWCLPVVNLFETTLEPMIRDDSEHEYRLVSRYQRADAFEVVGIQNVSLVNGDRIRELAPFYGLAHPRWQNDLGVYWHARRRDADWAGGQYEPGSETWLSLVDKRFAEPGASALPADETLVVKARCCNRNVPERLPFGGGAPKFRPIAEPLIEQATALLAPTATVRPQLAEASRWQFIRNLNLEHFAGDDACERLKAVLQLHDFRQTPESQTLIEGIDSVTIKRAVARVGSGVHRGACQGSEIIVRFSRPRYAGTSIYLFSAILDRFFAQFAQLNSFTRVRIRLSGHNEDYHVWPARAGERELL
ncbi:type VI secretion system baseplate subunit TssF [Marinobacter sp.]|uniref:type VI secretion system baseplate subunit TssF n=1 Tax=Marinobacter sp. TaxID=50741 RepID=UPI00384F3D9D